MFLCFYVKKIVPLDMALCTVVLDYGEFLAYWFILQGGAAASA